MTRVGALMTKITPKLTTAARFRFNLSQQDALDLLTAMYKYEVLLRQRNFILDDNTESNLISLSGFITSDSPKFGVMCCGACGNGKTTLLYAFQRAVNYLNNIKHFDFLSDEYSKFDARMKILRAKQIVKLSTDRDAFNNILSCPMLAIDDLGTEPTEYNDYSNINTPIVDLIDYRYNRRLFTFITTNLVAKQNRDTDVTVRIKYGNRTADRFNEMLHVIIFKNVSYRREKYEQATE